jgi:hypothetical protein
VNRYIDEAAVAEERLSGLPGLVKLAWDIALICPELGDEIIADLCADVRSVVDREAARVTAEADAAAKAKADGYWEHRFHRECRRTNDVIGSLASAISTEGIDPHGWYVYLLWPQKGADKPIYVGRSTNLLQRLGAHMSDWERRYATKWVSVISCPTEQAMEITEDKLIARYQPQLNIQGIRASGPAA